MLDDPQALEYLLQATLGSQARLVACRVLNRQLDYRVLLAQVHNPAIEVVIKLAGPAARMAGQFDATAAIYRRVIASTGLPVPEVLAVDIEMQAWPWRYLILRALPGAEWRLLQGQLNGPELARAYRQIGEAVGVLHTIGFQAFGIINANGQVAVPDRSALAALKGHAARIIPNRRLLELFLSVLEQRSTWFERIRAARLCHEDLHGANLLFSDASGQQRLSGILDFDKAWAGLPEADLARLELWRGMTTPDFWSGYRSIQPVEDGYIQRRPVYQLLWCLEFARQTPEHLADTRRVCQELDCPAIDRFDE